MEPVVAYDSLWDSMFTEDFLEFAHYGCTGVIPYVQLLHEWEL